MTDELMGILGRPNFTCIQLAGLMRETGTEIVKRAEAEQATIIHRLLLIWIEHGEDGYQAAAESYFKGLFDQAKAARQANEG